MFSKLAITAALSALLAVATALPAPQIDNSVGACNTGSLQCCNSLGSSQDSSFTQELPELIQVLVKGLDVVVGVQCDPITVIGATLSNTWSVSSYLSPGLQNLGRRLQTLC